ncbi:MAG: LPS export ABC transporter permease LptF [Deltaproteobacteria bacterium]|nr:LPS export ABC transporter permease LptF [Deltaproteobacteria bacterium]
MAILFVFAFIVLATRMLSITELIVTKGVGATLVGKMVLYLFPDIISFALPAAALMSVMLGFVRLGVDNEIIAMKSAGISLYQLLPPVLLISLIGLAISLWLGIMAVPWGNRSFKDLVFQIAKSKADLGIKERVFSEPFDGVVFYVNSFSRSGQFMKDVFVVDRRDPEVSNTILAKAAKIIVHPKERTIVLHFINGSIFMVDREQKSARTIQFKTYDLSIGLKDIMAELSSRRHSPKEMALGELWQNLKNLPQDSTKRNQMLVKLLEKAALPLGVFLMGLVGMPLGAQMRSRGKSKGIGLSLAIFVVYYLFMGGIKNLCETGAIPPALGVWIPDAFLLACWIYLFRRVVHERPIRLRALLFWRYGVYP